LLEEVPIHDTTLEQPDTQNRSRESVRMSYKIRDSIGNESMNDHALNPDVKYLQEMAKLQEDALLWTCFKYFSLPFYILGFLGFFFPYVYAFVPVH
jgi:hypothetical protein